MPNYVNYMYLDRLYRQPESPTEFLISAIKYFDVDAVQKLLKCDFDIEYRDNHDYSVLHTAIKLIGIGILRISPSEETADRRHPNPLFNSDALRRIVELLLESGRFNVNAFTYYCKHGCKSRGGYRGYSPSKNLSEAAKYCISPPENDEIASIP